MSYPNRIRLHATTPTDHAVCRWCRLSSAQKGSALNRCSRCKIIHYCSSECQKIDWKHHKEECKALLIDGAVQQLDRRARMTVIVGKWGHPESTYPPEPDTLYYLKTTIPHIGNISLCGPFFPPDTIARQIRVGLITERSVPGLGYFQYLWSLDHCHIQAVERFEAALPNGGEIQFEIVRHQKADVAAFVRNCPAGEPMPLYEVRVGTFHPDFSANEEKWKEEHPGLPPALSEHNLHGVFLTEDEASKAAWEVVHQWDKKKIPGSEGRAEVNDDTGMIVRASFYQQGVQTDYVCVNGRDANEFIDIRVTMKDGSILDVEGDVRGTSKLE